MPDHHDLANDLAAIVAYAEILGTTQLLPEQQQYVDEILASASSARQRIETLDWQPTSAEILDCFAHWLGASSPDASIKTGTSCSACGVLMDIGDRGELFVDTNGIIPPELLQYVLLPGFITYLIPFGDGASVDLDRVVRALHKIDGHLHLSTAAGATRLLVSLPNAASESRLAPDDSAGSDSSNSSSSSNSSTRGAGT